MFWEYLWLIWYNCYIVKFFVYAFSKEMFKKKKSRTEA